MNRGPKLRGTCQVCGQVRAVLTDDRIHGHKAANMEDPCYGGGMPPMEHSDVLCHMEWLFPCEETHRRVLALAEERLDQPLYHPGQETKEIETDAQEAKRLEREYVLIRDALRSHYKNSPAIRNEIPAYLDEVDAHMAEIFSEYFGEVMTMKERQHHLMFKIN